MTHLAFDPLRRMGLLQEPGFPAPRARIAPAMPAVQPRSGFISGDMLVEVRPLGACRAILPQWRELVAQAVEPNVFFGPDFLLGADQHLPEAAGCSVLLVWDRRRADAGEPAALLGLWPFRRGRLASSGMIRGLTSRYACSGAPLLDARFAVEAACAMLAALRHLLPGGSAALFGQMTLDGACARALRSAAAISDLVTHELDVAPRACLWPAPQRDETIPTADQAGAKQRKEMARLTRRLASLGDVRLVTAHAPEDVRDAMELFLALEASGWKARRGTSILCDVRDAAFWRSLSRGLSRTGGFSVCLLEAGERVVAAGLVMSSGRHAWYVKTAHDESLACHTPGALLSHHLGAALREAGEHSFIDSCAIPGHRMIERLWKGRVRVGDLVIGLSDDAPRAIGVERRQRRIRALAKRAWHRLRGWLA